MQAMERELCTQLTTLAVMLLSEADGTADQTQPKQIPTKGKGKKRAAETGGCIPASWHFQKPLPCMPPDRVHNLCIAPS